jgi:epoxyqueuosine reductase
MITLEDVRAQAQSLGYDDVGVTAAAIPDEDIQAYQAWLDRGDHAELAYMENALRCSPEQLLPGAKTAIIFVSYYKQEQIPFDPAHGVIASYARGRDYHHVHRKRLKKFIAWFNEKTGCAHPIKGFSDSTPIMEKALAVQAGLGWFGKNTLLIHRKFGTFTLLSGILTTLEIPHTLQPLRQARCGSCTRCLDACPTQALTPYNLNANLGLSYHLIESKKNIPDEIQSKNPGYIFGCDICQNVCPHNARKPLASTPEFNPSVGIGSSLNLNSLEKITQNPEMLHGTPLQRRGLSGLLHTWERSSR